MDRINNDTFGRGSEGDTPTSGTTGTGYGASAAGMSTGATPGANFGHAGGVEGTQSRSSGAEEMFGGAIDEGSDFSRGADSSRGTGTTKERAVAKAGELKMTLADKLEAGAGKLRQRSASTPAYAGAGPDGTTSSVEGTHELARVGEKVAGGMEMSADWLRNNDLNSMKDSVEKEVKANPARSLLIAAAAGYLLGKIFRR